MNPRYVLAQSTFMALAAVVLLLPAAVSAASSHIPSAVLYGRGTATIDGVIGGGEWDGARRLTFQAARPPNDGGGTLSVMVMAMNDSANVYLAVVVGRGTVGAHTQFLFYFDNNDDGVIAQGDEHLALGAGIFSPPVFVDGFWAPCVSGGAPVCPTADQSYGGSVDGTGSVVANGDTTTLELSHPLDDADNAHDWSLQPGSTVGFAVEANIFSESTSCNFGPNCQTYTVYPDNALRAGSATGYGNLVIAPDPTPPETTISGGPDNGAVVRARSATFTYGGTDNLTPPSGLSFSCSLDGGTYAACLPVVTVNDGQHILAVRATDELGNTDTTPATRTWRVDTTSPSTPTVRVAVARRLATVRVTTRDRDDAAGSLRYSCTLDSRPIAPCGPRFTVHVGHGAHTIRVRVRDPAGNQSATGIARFRLP